MLLLFRVCDKSQDLVLCLVKDLVHMGNIFCFDAFNIDTDRLIANCAKCIVLGMRHIKVQFLISVDFGI